MKEQDALIKTFDTAALGFQNFNNADRPDGALRRQVRQLPRAVRPARPDEATPRRSCKNYCGNSVVYSLLPILAHATLGCGSGSPIHTLCGAEIGLLQGQPGAPQAPHSPDLDLTHYSGDPMRSAARGRRPALILAAGVARRRAAG